MSCIDLENLRVQIKLAKFVIFLHPSCWCHTYWFGDWMKFNQFVAKWQTTTSLTHTSRYSGHQPVWQLIHRCNNKPYLREKLPHMVDGWHVVFPHSPSDYPGIAPQKLTGDHPGSIGRSAWWPLAAGNSCGGRGPRGTRWKPWMSIKGLGEQLNMRISS